MLISLWQFAGSLTCVTGLRPVKKVTEVTFPLRAKDNTTMVGNLN